MEYDISDLRRLTSADEYTVPELRAIAADHGVAIRSRASRDEVVAAIAAAGITVEHKPLGRGV